MGAAGAVCDIRVMLKEGAVQASCNASVSRFTSFEALTLSWTGEEALLG